MKINIQDNKTKFAKENWKEWFMVKIAVRYVQEGNIRPKFYLPVRVHYTSQQIECWIFPIALVMVPLYILKSALLSVWKDIYDLSGLYRMWNTTRRK